MSTLELKIEAADLAFSRYFFGENVEVVGHDGWDTSDANDFIMRVYATGVDEDSLDSSLLSFHVEFNSEHKVSDSYAYIVATGAEIGEALPTEVEVEGLLLKIIDSNTYEGSKGMYDFVIRYEGEDLFVVDFFESALVNPSAAFVHSVSAMSLKDAVSTCIDFC